MSNQDVIKALVKRMSGQANVIAIPRIYLDLLDNDHSTAFFLSQAVYWSDRSSAAGGWFWKSYPEWLAEIGLTQYQVNRAAKKCEAWVETKLKKANSAPTLHYRVDMDKLTEAIIKFLDNRESGLSRNSEIDYQETSQSLTETTSYIEEEEEEAQPQKPKAPETKAPLKAYVDFYHTNIGYPGAPGSVIYEGICEWAGRVGIAYWQECIARYAKTNGHTFTYLEQILTNGPRSVGQTPTTQPPTAPRPEYRGKRVSTPAAMPTPTAAEVPAPQFTDAQIARGQAILAKQKANREAMQAVLGGAK
jgi:hypothetical protein